MRKKHDRRRTDQKVAFRRKALAIFATIPIAVLAVSLALFAYRETFLTQQLTSTLVIASYILAVVGMTLSAGFNRSRIFFTLLLLVISQVALASPVPVKLNAKTYYEVIYYFSSILLPLNILAFSLMKDRGPLTNQGKRRLIFILSQLLVVAVVVVSQDKDILGYIHQELVSPALVTPLPGKALGMVAIALVILFLRQLNKVSSVDNAFFASLLALTAAFHFKAVPAALPVFYTSAIAMLTIAALQDSYSIAYLDELTGLPSRRSLQEALAKLGDKYTVAMVDIDYFKKINDTYGHDAGDDVLRFIATFISREVDGNGRAFRYGGEEFIVLFAGKEPEEVLPFVEELRERIAKRIFFLRGKAAEKRISVTVSIGLAQRDAKHSTPEEVVKAADIALYQAKGKGRNCVCR